MLSRLCNSCIFPCHCLALCPSTGWDTSLLFKVFELPLLLADQRFYAMLPTLRPEVRHVPCAVLIYSRSPQETYLRKRDRKIIRPLNSVDFRLSIISLQENYFDVHPKLRTKEQHYIEYVTGFFLEMCGQQVSSIVWYFERYTSNKFHAQIALFKGAKSAT